MVFELGGYDLEFGDKVTLSDGVNTKDTIVTEIEITDVDVENNTVSGHSVGGEPVYVIFCGYHEFGCVIRNTTASPEGGSWSVDFKTPVYGEMPEEARTLDLTVWMTGNAGVEDDDYDFDYGERMGTLLENSPIFR